MAVRFYLEKRKDKSGDSPIRVSIAIAGNRFLTTIGYNISEHKWNETTERVKQGCSNSKGETYDVINSRIKQIESYFSDYEIDYKRGKIETINVRQEWKLNFGNKKQPVPEKNIFDRLDEFVVEQGAENSWSKSVYNKFKTLKKHFKAFKSDLTFEYFTKDGLNEFVDYLNNVQIGGKKTKDQDTRVYGMKNSSIKRQIGFVKWFLRWATEKGYNTEMSFQNYKPKIKSVPTKVVFLEWEELMTVYNYPIPEEKEALDRVRDVFCFCCFTSLRYSDVANLRRSNVYSDHIEVTTVKTHDSLTIDLNDYSKAILKKYENETFPDNLALPVISNQKTNAHLKELGELCGIDEMITITYYKGNKRFDEEYPKYALMSTHTARRTFISNALMMGIPPQVVMKWTGHSDYSAMKPYIDIADKAKADAMKLFNKK